MRTEASNQSMKPTACMHVYEVRPRSDHRGVDLVSDALPFGRRTTDFRSFRPAPASQDRARCAQFAAQIRNTLKGKLGLSAGLHQVSGLGVRRFFLQILFHSTLLPVPPGRDDPA